MDAFTSTYSNLGSEVTKTPARNPRLNIFQTKVQLEVKVKPTQVHTTVSKSKPKKQTTIKRQALPLLHTRISNIEITRIKTHRRQPPCQARISKAPPLISTRSFRLKSRREKLERLNLPRFQLRPLDRRRTELFTGRFLRISRDCVYEDGAKTRTLLLCVSSFN